MTRYFSFQFYKEKWNHAGFRRYFKNVSWIFGTRVVTLATAFLTTLYIARVLGPTNFGELDYAIAIVGLFAWIGAWGIEGVLNRELIKHPEKRNELTGTAFILRIFFGVLATIITIIFALISPIESVSQVLILILAFTTILSAPQILQADFLARAESKYPSLITMAVIITTNIAKVIVILSGKGVIWLAGVMVLEQILYAMLYFVIYKNKAQGAFSDWSYSPVLAKVILKTGTAIAFLALFSMVYARIDQVMIRHILDAKQVGLYSAGVRLVDVWGFIPMMVLGGLYPAVLNARKISEELYHNRLRKVLALIVVPSILISILLFFTAPWLMSTIFGSEFIEGANALRVYGISLPATFIGYFVIQVLYTDDYRRILVISTVVAATVNIILNMFFIPAYGIVGAAWATTLSYPLTMIVPLLFGKTRKVFVDIFK